MELAVLQPKAQEPMTASAPSESPEETGSRQAAFGTTQNNRYPSPGTSVSVQVGSASSSVQPLATVAEVETEPSQTHQPLQPTQSAPGGQNAGGSGDGQDPSCLRGGATGNCVTEPFGCCLHWAKNICGGGHN